ncbi:MAG: HlyC/CorC family transporter [Deltaproteobacteria bacterium]|nr:HlyC/CorC family transporter [Deltaproteobacteria bacterium]
MEDDSEHGFFDFIKSLVKKKSHLDNSNDLTEEIHELMDEGQARGFISNEESDMVYGVLELKETQAHSIMIPRTEISSAPVDTSLGDIIKLVTACGHTRIVIYEDNIDKILGILHAKDLLKLWGKELSSKIPYEILRKPCFVPETRRISELLRELKSEQIHLAIVTDEYGGTAGIITIEDIIEEIVGEIMDEHDIPESLITLIDNNSFMVDARLEIEKLEEKLGLTFPRGNFESVGGFIIHLLGRIPEINEKVQYKELEMTIEQADQRKIDKIIIRCIDGPDLTKKKPVLQIDSNSEPDKSSLKNQI